MAMPHHPDENDDAPATSAPNWQAKALFAVIAILVIAFIALHLAGVFGP
jgi:hypothetical protein